MSLHQRLKYLEKQVRSRAPTTDYTKYQADPVGYCHDILQVRLTPQQERIARLLLTPPYRVLVRAAHSVGKSFLAACLTNWLYDCFPIDSCVLSTAPTHRQVVDILWKEVRSLRKHDPESFVGPKIPRLQSDPKHYATGFSTSEPEKFQGIHHSHGLLVFDEAVGLDPWVWEAATSMFTTGWFWLAIYNPTDVSSQCYAVEHEALTRNTWHVVDLPAITHPNIVAELANEEPPFPAAIRLQWLQDRFAEWTTPLAANDSPLITDLEWRDKWLRPGPIAEARLLARWPTLAINSVFSELAWRIAETLELEDTGPLQLGVDVARFGDDWTAFHIRKGGVSVMHESYNGWSLIQTSARAKSLVEEYGQKYGIPPRQVVIAIDDAGVGGGVTDILKHEAYNVVAVNGAGKAKDPLNYPNCRSNAWFSLATQMDEKQISLAKLPVAVRDELRRQAMAPTFRLDAQGRRVIEPKADTKKRLKRSPDDLDAMILAFYNVTPLDWSMVKPIENTKPNYKRVF